jgi:hypothetical protein
LIRTHPPSTHRERRAKYLSTLEKEVEYLRKRNVEISTDLTKKTIINDRLKVLLHAHHIVIPPEIDFVDENTFGTTIQVVGALDGLQSLRLSSSQPRGAVKGADVLREEDFARLGVSFVLALEQVCLRDHHNNIGEDGEVGHAMQLQASILNYAPATIPADNGPKVLPAEAQWTMPVEELEKQLENLYNTSQKLALDDEIVPVMCWMKVLERHKRAPISIKQLEALQKVLAEEVICYG